MICRCVLQSVPSVARGSYSPVKNPYAARNRSSDLRLVLLSAPSGSLMRTQACRSHDLIAMRVDVVAELRRHLPTRTCIPNSITPSLRRCRRAPRDRARL